MKHRSTLLTFSFMLLALGGLIATSLPHRVALARNEGSPSIPGVQDAGEPIVQQAVSFAETLPLSQIEESSEPVQSFRLGRVESNTERPEEVINPPLSGVTDSAQELQPTVQTSAPAPNVAAPSTNFEGLSNQDNAIVIGGRVSPPDTVGEVGLTQYVQATNLLFRVFDKTTGAPLTPPRRISALFTALPAASRCRTRDDGDPIVLYDNLANRWFISQFVAADPRPLSQCIAISQTSDATGAYFVYEFTSPNNLFADYPKYGVWPDGYYSTANQFNPPPNQTFAGVGVYAYDRAKMLVGDPTASYVYFNLQGAFPNQVPRSLLPSDADGMTPPPAGAPNVFAYYNANEFLNETDSLRLFNFTANFANPAMSTFTERADSPLAVAPFDPLNPSIAPNGRDDIEQPRPAPVNSASLDSIGDRLMNRLQYRNFGSFEALTVNHTVNAGTRTPGFLPTIAQYRAAPRYYQLRRDTPTGAFTIQNQGTFAPDTDERWMGSAALDRQGNLALGYSVSSLSVFPSIRYTGRLATDPANTLQSEQSIIAGKGSQTNANSRWGDYSAMTVDPVDDCTFYYTQEYYAFSHRTPAVSPFGVNWQTRVASFRFAECVPLAMNKLQINVKRDETGAVVRGALVTIDGILYGSTSRDGTFWANLMPGKHQIVISAPGAVPFSQTTIIVGNNKSATHGTTLVAERLRKDSTHTSVALTPQQGGRQTPMAR
ncbi:T9SS type A sorting domain-containing protein [soil metagenome]